MIIFAVVISFKIYIGIQKKHLGWVISWKDSKILNCFIFKICL